MCVRVKIPYTDTTITIIMVIGGKGVMGCNVFELMIGGYGVLTPPSLYGYIHSTVITLQHSMAPANIEVLT